MALSWRELHSGAGGALWAGQSPHLLQLTPNAEGSIPVKDQAFYVLGLAGGYYVEDFGGGEVHHLHDAVVFDWQGGRQGLRAIYAVEQHGDAHLTLHGAAKAALPDGDFLFFGGGNPAQSSSRVSRLTVHPTLRRASPNRAEADALLRDVAGATSWAAVRHPDGTIGLLAPDESQLPIRWSALEVDSTSGPGSRHGLQACVHRRTGDFVIFGGRGDSTAPGCHNDVWALNLGRRPASWRRVETTGTLPPAKVWYGALATASGSWVIYGGSQWQFEESAVMDRGVLWVLDLHTWAWSSVLPATGSPVPELPVACSLLEDGGSILVLGGCMPHKLGAGANERSFERCHHWYSSLASPWRVDPATGHWHQEVADAAAVPVPGDTMYRSHVAAMVVPNWNGESRGHSVMVFGGSRYFTGAYFHDVLELRFGVGEAPTPEQRPQRPWFRRLVERRPDLAGDGSRGREGRYRAMAREGLLVEPTFG